MYDIQSGSQAGVFIQKLWSQVQILQGNILMANDTSTFYLKENTPDTANGCRGAYIYNSQSDSRAKDSHEETLKSDLDIPKEYSDGK